MLAQVEQQENQLVATPLDDRVLATIKLPDGDSQYLQEEPTTSVVEVQLDRYPVAQFPAEGHVARQLPLNGGRTLIVTFC